MWSHYRFKQHGVWDVWDVWDDQEQPSTNRKFSLMPNLQPRPNSQGDENQVASNERGIDCITIKYLTKSTKSSDFVRCGLAPAQSTTELHIAPRTRGVETF